MDAPAPQIHGQIDERGKVIHQERVSERVVKQIVNIPVPQIMGETVEAIQLVLEEQIPEYIVEEIIVLVPNVDGGSDRNCEDHPTGTCAESHRRADGGCSCASNSRGNRRSDPADSTRMNLRAHQGNEQSQQQAEKKEKSKANSRLERLTRAR